MKPSGIKAGRLEELLRNAVEDIRNAWSDGYEDVKAATGITEGELIALGFPDAGDPYEYIDKGLPENYTETTADEMLENFQKFVFFCDDLKRLYHEANAIQEIDDDVFPLGECCTDEVRPDTPDEKVIEQAQEFLCELYRDEPVREEGRDDRSWFETQFTRMKQILRFLEERKELVMAMAAWRQFLDCADDPLWKIPDENHRKYWNEVELPWFVEKMLCAYADALPDDVGIYKGDEFVDGVVEISFYDLSDWDIVFRNAALAEAFNEKDGVEPCNILDFHDGAWYCR